MSGPICPVFDQSEIRPRIASILPAFSGVKYILPCTRAAAPAGELEGVPTFGPINAERLPSYHRLDLRASREWRLQKGNLTLFLEIQNAYDRLNVAGFDRPLVIHGVQHVFHPPAQLECWPGDDRRSKIVFITHDLEEAMFADTLKAFNEDSAVGNHTSDYARSKYLGDTTGWRLHWDRGLPLTTVCWSFAGIFLANNGV